MSQSGSATQVHHLLAEYTDSVDALPHDLTRSFGDLRELDAVLRSSMQTIIQKIRRLVELIKDPTVPPSDRLLLFLDIAEDAQRLKMGSEDKIRVAGRTCDDLAMHTQHTKQILSMLAALDPTYDSALHMRQTTFPHVAPSNLVTPSGDSLLYGTGRRKRIPTNTINSINPLSTTTRNAASALNGGANGQLQAQRKRRGEDEDTASNANAGGNKKTPKGKEKQPDKDKERERLQQEKERHKNKKLKPSHRSPSPLDHRDPNNIRQYPNVNDGHQPMHPDYVSQHPQHRGKPNGQHPEMSQMYPNAPSYRDESLDPYGQPYARGDREHSTMSNHLNGNQTYQHQGTHMSSSNKRPPKATGTSSLLDVVASRAQPNLTPNSASTSSGGHGGAGADNASSAFDDDDYEFMDVPTGMNRGDSARSRRDDDHDVKPGSMGHRGGNEQGPMQSKDGSLTTNGGEDPDPGLGVTIVGDADDTPYCFCGQVSFGEMIGCDDDDCEREWFHLSCLGMAAPPKGEWFCKECSAKRAAAAAGGKKNNRSNRSNAGGGGNRATTNSVATNGSSHQSSRGRASATRA